MGCRTKPDVFSSENLLYFDRSSFNQAIRTGNGAGEEEEEEEEGTIPAPVADIAFSLICSWIICLYFNGRLWTADLSKL